MQLAADARAVQTGADKVIGAVDLRGDPCDRAIVASTVSVRTP